MMRSRILIVDDEELIRWSLKSSLMKAGYEALEANSGKKALSMIQENEIDLVILDLVLQDISGLEVLQAIRKTDNSIEVIMMTAFGSVSSAVEAMKYGALDYLTKPFNLDEVVIKVKRALDNAERSKELERLRNNLAKQLTADQIVYKSQAMQDIMNIINKICQAKVDIVLLTGETGVGKGLLARSIHSLGIGTKGPFVTLNCTAIPDNLLESELFGYEKGAFTDAKGRKEGVVEQAKGGTLFLDEIGDMPYKLQGKLLRFIEEKRIRRIGGNKEIEVDLKLISATNRDLRKAMEAGEFRADLYHRLSLIHLWIPPLRERKEDILPLAEFFLKKFNLKYNKNIKGFTDGAVEILQNYSWPGNVRELSNIIERFCILENTTYIKPSQLAGYLLKIPIKLFDGSVAEISLNDENVSFDSLLNDFKKHILKMALQKCNYNKTKAAKYLKMDRSTFKYQLKMVNLDK